MFETLYKGFGLNENGFKFPTFTDFLKIVTELGKVEFGSDFEIDNKTALGQFFEIFCYTMEGQSKLFQTIYNNLDIYTMKGVMLDKYGSNISVERLSNTRAYATLEFKGVPYTLVPQGFKVKSSAGKFYTTVNNVSLDSSGLGYGQVLADEPGELSNTSLNTINEKVTANENVYTINNITSAIGGADLESDTDYRNRLIQFFLGSESSSANGIRRAMLSLPQVQDCHVLENYTMVDDPVTGLKPGQISVIINGLIDHTVGKKLLEVRAAGVCTVGNISVETLSDSGQYVTQWFRQAVEIPLYIKVSNVSQTGQRVTDIEKTIKDNILNNMKGFTQLGVKVNYEKILSYVYGLATVDEADISISKDNVNFVTTDIIPAYFQYFSIKAENIKVTTV